MMFRVAALLTVAAAAAAAKGPVVKISITGQGLATPLVITDESITRKFAVWTGPGVRVNGKAVHLDRNYRDERFIDWASGPQPAEETGKGYEVSFLVKFRDDSVRLAYTVVYKDGLMLIPGGSHPAYPVNVRTILHDVEGQWFRASDTWEQTIRPLLMKALAQ